jgi:hypothetical protein
LAHYEAATQRKAWPKFAHSRAGFSPCHSMIQRKADDQRGTNQSERIERDRAKKVAGDRQIRQGNRVAGQISGDEHGADASHRAAPGGFLHVTSST